MRYLGPPQATDLRVPDRERQLPSLSLTFGGAPWTAGRRRGLTADPIATGGPRATSRARGRLGHEAERAEELQLVEIEVDGVVAGLLELPPRPRPSGPGTPRARPRRCGAGPRS